MKKYAILSFLGFAVILLKTIIVNWIELIQVDRKTAAYITFFVLLPSAFISFVLSLYVIITQVWFKKIQTAELLLCLPGFMYFIAFSTAILYKVLYP